MSSARPAVPSAARSDAWLALLIKQFPELLTELAPGRTARRSGPGRPPKAPAGGGAAPIRIHVSDAIRDIADGVIELEEAVLDRLGEQRPRKADVPTRLRRIAALQGRIAADPVLAQHVRTEIRRMARRCTTALGEAEPLVNVGGRCPWCDSVSLRAFPARSAVLCINPACRCGDSDCGCVDSPAYRHTWNERQWGELARLSGLAPQALAEAADGEPR
ncbi:hypothetical protein [Streptomyces sp. NPDC048650]|uniref:hypothetical protein n=1 Tax=unclassified Streptomyces TaxID=2593676 RepID=UPI0037241793